MIGVKVTIIGGMSIIDGHTTYHAEPIVIENLSPEECREIAEEARRDRVRRVHQSKELQYAKRRGRKRLPAPAF